MCCLRLGVTCVLAGDRNKGSNYIRRAIKLDGKYQSKFLEDDMFDAIWEKLI